jgi:hypothetical protein
MEAWVIVRLRQCGVWWVKATSSFFLVVKSNREVVKNRSFKRGFAEKNGEKEGSAW